jgi:ATP-binding cassette subfamily C protein
LPETDDSRAAPGTLQGEIEVSNICFRYIKDGPLILNDLSLHIKPKQFVAIVGGSGSGKSTLLRLLLGFETAESGAIFFDSKELSGIDIRMVRRQGGVVLQNAQLMSGDIFTNIVGTSVNLTIDDAWDAARAVGLAEDIEDMPMGMHTIIAEGGGGLSGGQRQRLVIARAIVHKPRILYFDEATSALDNRTQAMVTESLEKLQATRVVIAHRLSTIRNADCIFAIDRGNLIESGTYEELMQKDGYFANKGR